MRGTCDTCNKETETLEELILNNDENKMVCKKCLMHAEERGDIEYERQREEGI